MQRQPDEAAQRAEDRDVREVRRVAAAEPHPPAWGGYLRKFSKVCLVFVYDLFRVLDGVLGRLGLNHCFAFAQGAAQSVDKKVPRCFRYTIHAKHEPEHPRDHSRAG